MKVEELDTIPPRANVIYIDDAGRQATGEYVRYYPELGYCKLFVQGERGLQAHYVNPEDIRKVKG